MAKNVVGPLPRPTLGGFKPQAFAWFRGIAAKLGRTFVELVTSRIWKTESVSGLFEKFN